MAREAQGELRWANGAGVARITLGKKRRKSFPLTASRTRDEAIKRCGTVAQLAARFRRAGVIDTRDAKRLLETAAGCGDALLAGVLEVAQELIGGELVDANGTQSATFADIAGDWTSHKIHKAHPDHVKVKDSELDETRLKKLCAIDVGGVTLGEIPLDRFTLDHAESAMRQLPKDAKRPATRRQYAQLIHRVLQLAVYPCRVIKVNPLPKGFMPKIGKPPGFSFLYPEEEARMARHRAIPLPYRMLWGFLAREGTRSGEAITLRVGVEVDLVRGVISLDQNKTDDARAWAMDPGVLEALQRWVKLRRAKKGDLLFTDDEGRPLESDRLAERLRRHLMAAGVDREELHAAGVNRGQFRVHDLRGTFVTLALPTAKLSRGSKTERGTRQAP